MIKLKLLDAQKFKIHIEEKIRQDSLFFHEYKTAAGHLNQIWQMQEETEQEEKREFAAETPNNIIAFCGERGSGKSSVMLSFVNAVINCGKEENVLSFDRAVRENGWSHAAVTIDPSMFDEVHNIVDIVLAHIYQSFADAYEADNQRLDTYEREKMIGLLAKTYKSLSIIKKKEKMLDDEYDIAGNVSKLQKLGQSTRLKQDLRELIDHYLMLLPGLVSSKKDAAGWKSKKLLIAIDDLDLCNEHAYEMAEQVRKYLILPNVVVLMAIRIEQLQMGVEEKNREDFKQVIAGRNNDPSIAREMKDMAERYVTKLIPMARRIYLPELRSDQVSLVPESREDQQGKDDVVRTTEESKKADNEESLEQTILRLIREKTGMYFVTPEEGPSYFVSANLREFVNLASLLMAMPTPTPGGDQASLDNIDTFQSYFTEGMLKKNISWERLEWFLEIMKNADSVRNYNIGMYLNGLLDSAKQEYDLYQNSLCEFPNMSLSFVAERLASVSRFRTRREDWRLFYYIRVYYTILLNARLCANGKIPFSITGGFLWGNRLGGLLPAVTIRQNQHMMNRERFFIPALRGWNETASVLHDSENSLSVPEKDASQAYVSKIEDEHWLAETVCWLLLALVSAHNGKTNYRKNYMNRAPIVYNNYAVPSVEIEISLENYIVNLCDPEDLYRIANLELLGITRERIQPVLEAMKAHNAPVIRQAKIVAANMDLADRLLQYCQIHNDYKERTQSKEDRTYRLYGLFFKNVRNYLKMQGAGEADWTQLWIPTGIKEDGQIEGVSVDMNRLFTKLCAAAAAILRENSGEGSDSESAKEGYISYEEGQRKKQEFAQQVQTVAQVDYAGSLRRISGSLQNKTADYVRFMLETIGNSIQKYTFREKKLPAGFDPVPLIQLYAEVVDLCVTDPKKEITEIQYNTYKTIARIKDVIG